MFSPSFTVTTVLSKMIKFSFHVRQCIRKPFTLAVTLIVVLLLSVISVLYNHSISYPIHPSSSSPVGVARSQLVSPSDLAKSQVSSPSGLARRQVMLLSYGRSGSTFTAALIAHHPDVFYTFEPLFFMARLPNGSVNERFQNIQEERSIDVIKSVLTCEFQIDAFSKFDNVYHRNIDSSKTLFDCLYSPKNGFSHLSCYQEYIESCKSQKISLVKTIRFKVKWTEWFLKKYPNFKLVILVRDPRAVLFSQASVFRKFDWKTEVSKFSLQHCSTLADDIKLGEALRRQYPGRVLGIRFEDGAMNPFEYSKKIYRFLGLDYDKSLVDYIENLKEDEEDKTFEAYSIRRGNSTLAMNRWRYLAGFSIVNKTTQTCGHILKKLGYKFVYSQKDLESDRLLVGSHIKSDLFT